MNIFFERITNISLGFARIATGLIFILYQFCVLAQSSDLQRDLKRATDYFIAEQYDSSIVEYTKIIDSTNFYHAYYCRALCYYKLENNSLALIDFYNPDVVLYYQNDTSYLWYRGQTHHRLNQWEQALLDYRKAEENGINMNDQIGLSIGTVYYFLGKNEQAKRYLTSFLSNNTNVEGGWTNLGWVYLNENLIDSAEYAFNHAYSSAKLLRADSLTIAKCLNNLGYAKGLNGKLNGGLKLIRRSLGIWPNNPFAYRNMGYLFMELDDTENACKYLTIALELGIEKKWNSEFIQELVEFCKK